jgi:hypothetical protein
MSVITSTTVDSIAATWWASPAATVALEDLAAQLAAAQAGGTIRVELVAGTPDKIEVLASDGIGGTLAYQLGAPDAGRSLDAVTKLGMTWAAMKAASVAAASLTPDVP